ncbi:hypothetical protein ABTZ58_07555 [Streptomyces sp. NPDC094143]|uniref:SCO2400 family protein n=1 Tax=Streptomyces sp. NPDC094143 TaxID=3155310 RepID=UPI00332A735C
MDYCSSCRRHLNGALVCPGCGAYAPDIDPTAGDGRTGRASATAAAGPAVQEYPAVRECPTAAGTWHDGTLWDGAPAGPRDVPGAGDGRDEAAGTGPADAYEAPDTGLPDGYAARPQGRAARRRQLARWKKNQRRAVVATAVALVGGGLTVSAMSGDAAPGVQAATTPEDTPMGGAKGEAPAYTEPAAGQNAAPRTSPTTPPYAGRVSRHQQPRAADPRIAPADTRTDTAATPRELPLTTPPRRTTAPSAADTATGSSGSAGSGATDPTAPPAAGSDAQQPAPPAAEPPATSPTSPTTPPSDPKPKELCLLVICLG